MRHVFGEVPNATDSSRCVECCSKSLPKSCRLHRHPLSFIKTCHSRLLLNNDWTPQKTIRNFPFQTTSTVITWVSHTVSPWLRIPRWLPSNWCLQVFLAPLLCRFLAGDQMHPPRQGDSSTAHGWPWCDWRRAVLLPPRNARKMSTLRSSSPFLGMNTWNANLRMLNDEDMIYKSIGFSIHNY